MPYAQPGPAGAPEYMTFEPAASDTIAAIASKEAGEIYASLEPDAAEALACAAPAMVYVELTVPLGINIFRFDEASDIIITAARTRPVTHRSGRAWVLGSASVSTRTKRPSDYAKPQICLDQTYTGA